jgi:hypothetical protein
MQGVPTAVGSDVFSFHSTSSLPLKSVEHWVFYALQTTAGIFHRIRCQIYGSDVESCKAGNGQRGSRYHGYLVEAGVDALTWAGWVPSTLLALENETAASHSSRSAIEADSLAYLRHWEHCVSLVLLGFVRSFSRLGFFFHWAQKFSDDG